MTRERIAKGIGLALGVVAITAALSAWQVSSTGAALGADLEVVAVPSGELMTSPSAAFVQASGLRPGTRPVTGATTVRNITGRPVRVQARALPSGRDLDGVLQVELRDGDRRLARATLGELRAWSAGGVPLAVGATRRLSMRAWLAPGAAGRTDGTITTVTLELRAVGEDG